MKKEPPRQHLDPDGVRIEVDWKKFQPNTSVFVPAVNLSKLIRQFYSITNRNRWLIHHTEWIENGKLGVRFWRVL